MLRPIFADQIESAVYEGRLLSSIDCFHHDVADGGDGIPKKRVERGDKIEGIKRKKFRSGQNSFYGSICA